MIWTESLAQPGNGFEAIPLLEEEGLLVCRKGFQELAYSRGEGQDRKSRLCGRVLDLPGIGAKPVAHFFQL